MEKQYSLKSVTFTNFYECIEKLKNKISYKTIRVYQTFGHYATEKSNFDFTQLKSVKSGFDLHYTFYFSEDTFPNIGFESFNTILKIGLNGFNEVIEEELFNTIESLLKLLPPDNEDIREISTLEQITNTLWHVYDSIEELREIQLKKNNETERNCFLSFRFDDHSKSLAFELKEFLDLCNINVISGLGYEPRSVSEKVLSRLTQKIDLFILINSLSGDSAWINQEIGVAKSKNIPIVVLNEERTDEKSSLLGDNEYIIFPKNIISKSFIGILQALKYIEKK